MPRDVYLNAPRRMVPVDVETRMSPELLWAYVCKAGNESFSGVVRRVCRHIDTKHVEKKAAGEATFHIDRSLRACNTPSGMIVKLSDLPLHVATSIIANALSDTGVVNQRLEDKWVIYVK